MRMSQVHVRFMEVDVGGLLVNRELEPDELVAVGPDPDLEDLGKSVDAALHDAVPAEEQFIALHPIVNGPRLLLMIVSASQTG